MEVKKRKSLILLLLAIFIVFTGCKKDNQGSTGGSKAPENVYQTILLFKEETNREAIEGMSVGSLYIKKENEEVELIAKDVLDYARYDNETEEVLYLDDESNLYHFANSDEKPTFIAKDVNSMNFTDTKDKKIVYIENDDSVYVYNDGSSEKIGSNVGVFQVIGNDVYYNTHEDNHLIVYNIETREEKRIASNVSDFRLLNDSNKILYLSEDYSLYYLDDREEKSLRISSNPVSLDEVVIIDEKIYFTEYHDSGNQLFLEDLSENSRPEVVADDVYEFKVDGDTIYYLSSDSILYKLKDQGTSKRIAVDVVEFDQYADQLVFLDEDQNLHSWNTGSEELSTVGHDVVSYEMFTNGKLYYLTDNNDLFREKTKLASDVDYYSVFYDTLAYANDQSLYLIKGEEEHLILEDSLDDYSVVYYQNNPVYENRLTLTDISGFWKFTDEAEEEQYLNIKSNGKMTGYSHDSEDVYDLEVFYSGYNDLQVMIEEYGEYLSFYYEEENLIIKFDSGQAYSLTRSSLTELDTYRENYEKEQEEKARQEEKERKEEEAREKERQIQEEKNQSLEEASYVVEDFIRDLAPAVNNGEFYIISQYINPSSSFYDKQSEFVYDLYERGIVEELYDYDIIEMTMNDDQSITVKTREVFRVYNPETDKDSQSTYQAKYTLKKINGEYLIDQLDVE